MRRNCRSPRQTRLMDGPLMIIIDPLIRILLYVLQLYIWVLIISAILRWLVAFNVVNTSNRVVYLVGDVLYRLTEPALRPIRRFIPYLGGIDISPVVLLLGIVFVPMVLVRKSVV